MAYDRGVPAVQNCVDDEAFKIGRKLISYAHGIDPDAPPERSMPMPTFTHCIGSGLGGLDCFSD